MFVIAIQNILFPSVIIEIMISN